jgi:hypothetical protein
LTRVREALDTGALLSRERQPEQARLFLEDGIGWLVHLRRVQPADELTSLLGEAGVSLAFVAFNAGRLLLVRRGGAVAIECYGELVEKRGQRDRIDKLGGAYVGLGSMLAFFGEEEEAKGVFDEMRARFGRLDPVNAALWSRKAQEALQGARSARGA